MSWLTWVVVGFVCVVLDVSIAPLLAIGGVHPSFVLVLVVFVSLFAPKLTALWAAWLIGLMMDLCTPLASGAQATPVIGPGALGFVAACIVVLQVRSLLFRRRALTAAVVTFAGGLAVALVTFVLATIHTWYAGGGGPWVSLAGGGVLARGIGVAFASSVLALLFAPVLVWSAPVWGFRSGPQRSAMMRFFL